MECSTCTTQCMDCVDFELAVSTENNIDTLKGLRKDLMQYRVKLADSIQGRFADWLTAKVGTMGCMAFFLLFVCLPFAVPKLTEMVQFIGGTAIPLVLMSLFLISANRSDQLREQKTEREYRIQIIYDRIEELREEGNE